MSIVEDLEGIVAKLMRLAKVWCGMRVGMEFLLIDQPDHSLRP